MAGVWIVSDNRGHALELLNIGRQLATKIGTRVSALLCQERKEIQDYFNYGADEVVLLPSLDAEQPQEDFVSPISEEARRGEPDLILLPATPRGKNMAALLASRLNAGLVSACVAIDFDEKENSFVMARLIYGGAGLQKVTCSTRPALATIPPKTFEAAKPLPGRQGLIRELPAPSPSRVKVIERRAKEKEAKDISEARVIICVGRGMEKKEDLLIARQLAEVLGGAIGCTRPISEELHWLPEDLCIGLSGLQIRPDLYIGIGVSGQVQHLTGIRNARVIAAVNKDENAPIFKAADFGIVGDLYEVIPKLISEIKNRI
ncbi:MAG TPA: electron transfer flavoprotein subunit alpha/FixB family protein [Syntrophales bacterium]|nr:electron transfer flavoprotein subunit alpha/FixB family protein [Syntrophales bacterium]